MFLSLLIWLSALLLFLVVVVLWAINLLGAPGNWLIVAATVVYVVLMSPEHRVSISWPVVAGLLALALLGEVVEFAAGLYGAAKAGSSRRGAALALIGSLAGALIGVLVGLPIPLVGSVIAALIFASAGALIGAMLGEQWAGRDLAQSWNVGQSAFWGRLLGTTGKILIGCVMVALIAAALVV